MVVVAVIVVKLVVEVVVVLVVETHFHWKNIHCYCISVKKSREFIQ